MESSRKYFDPQLLAQLEGLGLRARTIVEGYVAGVHRSPYQGFSVEFAEHREYVPGDDVRHVDWKVFGRTDKFYLKQFEEETNLVCYLVVDGSQSMSYRGPLAAFSKLEYGCTAAAALAYLVLQQQDSVGLTTFDYELRTVVRPGSRPAHLKPILEVLEGILPRERTAAGPILHDLAERFTRRGVVAIFSDLFDDLDSLAAGLAHLRHRRHEVIVFHVLDRAELSFDFRRPTLFRGLEGLGDVLADPRALRRAYLDEFGRYLGHLRRVCRQHRIDYVLLATDQPLQRSLSGYLAARQKRGWGPTA